VQEIHIRWPSGKVQTLKNVKSDQFLRVDEPLATTALPSLPQRSPAHTFNTGC